MRIFGNINGVDILHSDTFMEEGIEKVNIVVIGYNQNGKKRSAVCKLPEITWSEITNFDDETIKYLEKIINYHKEIIMKESREKIGREYKEMIPIKFNGSEVIVQKDFLEN